MRLEQVNSIDGTTIYTDSGAKFAIGSAPHAVGDFVWTDGNYVFGHQDVKNTPVYIATESGNIIIIIDFNNGTSVGIEVDVQTFETKQYALHSPAQLFNSAYNAYMFDGKKILNMDGSVLIDIGTNTIQDVFIDTSGNVLYAQQNTDNMTLDCYQYSNGSASHKFSVENQNTSATYYFPDEVTNYSNLTFCKNSLSSTPTSSSGLDLTLMTWDSNRAYLQGYIALVDDAVYQANKYTIGNDPTSSTDWDFIGYLVPGYVNSDTPTMQYTIHLIDDNVYVNINPYANKLPQLVQIPFKNSSSDIKYAAQTAADIPTGAFDNLGNLISQGDSNGTINLEWSSEGCKFYANTPDNRVIVDADSVTAATCIVSSVLQFTNSSLTYTDTTTSSGYNAVATPTVCLVDISAITGEARFLPVSIITYTQIPADVSSNKHMKSGYFNDYTNYNILKPSTNEEIIPNIINMGFQDWQIYYMNCYWHDDNYAIVSYFDANYTVGNGGSTTVAKFDRQDNKFTTLWTVQNDCKMSPLTLHAILTRKADSFVADIQAKNWGYSASNWSNV